MKSVRTRLVLLYVGLVFLLLTLLAGVSYGTQHADLRTDFQRRLESETHYYISYVLEQINRRRDQSEPIPPQAIEAIRLLSKVSQGEVLLQTEDGKNLVEDDAIVDLLKSRPVSPRVGETQQVTDGDLTTLVTIAGDRWGRRFLIAYGLRWEPYRERLEVMVGVTRVLVLTGTAVSFLFAYFFLSRALRPIDSMSRLARDINANNLAQKIEVPEQSAEFTHLANVLNEMLARIEASFTQLRTVMADVSHESKTPLANIRLRLESMLDERKPPDELREIAARALEDLSRVSHMLSNLLFLSQLQVGAAGFRSDRIDAARLTHDVAETAQLLCAQKGVELELAVSPDLFVKGDEDALRRSLANIVNNAIRHTPERGRVSLRLSAQDGRIEWSVSDTGPGISAEVMAKMFQRFNRGTAGGTGLGLAITKAIVDAHGGSIRVENHEPSGASVSIALPRTP